MTEPLSLAGLRMHASETAPGGVVNRDTCFEFEQEGATVSARYAGGGISLGLLVGRLEGARLVFRFAQLTGDGRLDGGRSECEVERTPDGRVRLLEHFTWESREGGGTNVIEEPVP